MKIEDLAPEGTKQCEGKCERKIIMTESGPIIICIACQRIVIDRSKK